MGNYLHRFYFTVNRGFVTVKQHFINVGSEYWKVLHIKQKMLWPSKHCSIFCQPHTGVMANKYNKNQGSFCTHSGVDMYQYYRLTLQKLGQHNTFPPSPCKGKVSYRVFIDSYSCLQVNKCCPVLSTLAQQFHSNIHILFNL